MKQTQLELLVLSAQNGNRNSLALLYRYFSPKMRQFAMTLVPMGDTDDLVQVVWMKVMKRIQRLDEPAVFTSWLYRALRWEAADWHKHPQNKNRSAEDDVGDLVASEQNAIEEESEVIIALRQLSIIEQQIVNLHYLNEMSLKEIALSLDVPVGTAKSRLHRAREALRIVLTTKMEKDNE